LKRTLVAFLLLATVLIPISSAGAATSEAKQIKLLQKQVKVMQKQVKTLQKQVKTVNTEAMYGYLLGYVNIQATTCVLAVVADNFQATWKALDSNAGIIGAPFTALAAAPQDDYGACADAGITRQTGLPLPSWTAYDSLMNYLYGT
jgi:hypothetical protein